MSSARSAADDCSPTKLLHGAGASGSPVVSRILHRRDDVGSPLSPLPTSPGDAVLTRMRDTIRRLHNEGEEERSKRLELQHQLRAKEADLRHLQGELDREREGRQDKSLEAHLRAQLAEAQRRTRDAESLQVATSEQLQRAKSDVSEKTKLVFGLELKVAELEKDLQRSEARVLSAEQEVTRCNSKLSNALSRMSDMEREVKASRSAAKAETDRADLAQRAIEEHRQLREVLQSEVESLQASASSATRAANDAKMRMSDDLAKAVREKNAAIQAAAEAASLSRDLDESMESSIALENQVAELKEKSNKAEQKVFMCESDLASVKNGFQRCEKLESRVIELEQNLCQAQDRSSAKDSELILCRAELQASALLKTRVVELEHECDKSSQQKALLQSEIGVCKSELQSQSSVWQSQSGDFKSQVRELENARDKALGELEQFRKDFGASGTELATALADGSALRQSVRLLQEEHKAEASELGQVQKSLGIKGTELATALSDGVAYQQLARRSQEEHQFVAIELERARKDLAVKGVELATSLSENSVSHHRVQCLLEEQQTVEARYGFASKEQKDNELQLVDCRRRLSELSSEFHQEMQEQTTRMETTKRITQLKLEEQLIMAEAGREQVQKKLEDCQGRLEEEVQRRIAPEKSTMEVRLESELQRVARQSDNDSGKLEFAECKRLEEEFRWEMEQSREEKVELERSFLTLRKRADSLVAELQEEQRKARESSSVEKQLREALHSSQDEIDSLEEAVEKVHQRYERKLAKSHRQLAERETYEERLKCLLDKEVDVLHQYNRELATFPPSVTAGHAKFPFAMGPPTQRNLSHVTSSSAFGSTERFGHRV